MKHSDIDYDYGQKRNYRRKSIGWAIRMAKQFWHLHPKELRIIYLESSQGLETEFLLRKGFSPKNLIPVNINPAIVAVINRKFPKVHGAGVDLARSITERLERGERIHIYDLDFCSCIGQNVKRALNSITSPEAIILFNLLKGRERTKQTLEMFSVATAARLDPGDEYARDIREDRVLWIHDAIPVFSSTERDGACIFTSFFDEYKSTAGYQHFLYGGIAYEF